MKYIVVMLFSFLTFAASACPELNNVDLASSYDKDEYSEIGYRKLPSLTKEDFLKYPVFSDFEYEYCHNALAEMKVQATQTGEIYTIIMTVEDHCDGGNSYGNILDEKGRKVLGSIGDSFISCF